MPETSLPLSGIELQTGDPVAHREWFRGVHKGDESALSDAEEHFKVTKLQIIEEAISLGAEVTTTPIYPQLPLRMQPGQYRLDPVFNFWDAVDHELSSVELPLPRTDPPGYDHLDVPSAMQDLDEGRAFVAAFKKTSLGSAKYLIEDRGQLAALERLRADLLQAPEPADIAPEFEIRQYVETPSERFTSYRIVASCVGEVLAASLIYSAHTKEPGKIIAIGEEDGSSMSDRKNPTLAAIRRHLEIPGSPYFLGSKDIRSNVALGGKLIPLMGEAAYQVTDAERQIMQSHDIDPSRVEVPRPLAEAAQFIGKTLGPRLSLVSGIDFIQREDGRHYMLEINPGPGPLTYNRCWGYEDEDNGAMLGAALASLADYASGRSG